MSNINSYIWKDKKIVVNKTTVCQNEIKMIDMSETELNDAYQHCKNMLYNNSKYDPGRYLVLDEISTQINNCAAELAIRWFCQLTDDLNNFKYSRFSLLSEIKTLIDPLKKIYPENHIFRLQDLYSGIPTDFTGITIDSIIKGCKDTLGKFNKKHITKSFIVKQGIWFTPEEMNDFKTVEKLKTTDEILKTIKERLGLTMSTDLRIKSSGLNYNQFRSMINLKINKKYSELTTNQLEILKNRILFTLEEDIFFHIKNWQTLMSKIEEVCVYKNYKL